MSAEDWTAAEDEILRTGLLEQGLSYAEVARLLPGRTKNAAQSRAIRKGWATATPAARRAAGHGPSLRSFG